MGSAPSLDDALAHHRAGRVEEAARLYRALLAGHAQEADLHHLLALALSAAAPAESRAALRRAMALAPSAALYAHNAARLEADPSPNGPTLAHRLGRALALDPTPAEAHHRLGLLEAHARRWRPAGRGFRRALALDPALPPALYDLANLEIATGRRPEAITVFRRLLRIAPGHVPAWSALGPLLSEAGREGSGACFQRALALDPAAGRSWQGLASLLIAQGRVRAGIAARLKAVALDPDTAQVHYETLPFLHLDPGLAPEAQLAWRRRVHRRFSDPLTHAVPPHRNTPDPERRLRIGYVDDRLLCRSTHSTNLLPMVEAHDRRRVELVFYTNLPEEEADDMTRRYAATAAAVRHVAGLDDEALASRVRDDAIDILIDVAGHLTGTRAGLFARKPAPLQVTMLQVGSSGMAAMDYAVADPVLLPPGRPEHFSEKILRLPAGFLFEPVADLTPPVLLPPIGHPVTFGSLNLLAKIDETVLALWARVLARTPGSRLLLKAAGLADPTARRRIAGILHGLGIDPARLDLRPWTRGHADHLAVYGEIDVMLDCFPYPGMTTSMEALLMGVPVVTLAGDRFVARIGEAILTAIGHPEWIAADPDRYVEIAAGLAADPDLRARLRGDLRRELLASPLCDPRRFTAALEDAFSGIWRDWCRGGTPGPERKTQHK